MRAALVLAAALLLGALAWVVIGSAVGPLTRTCSPALEPGACEAAVAAVLRRGTPALHPLILSAHVEPGNAPGADALGHRATVTYQLAAIPASAEVELHFDQGAHWGGHPEPSEPVLNAMALQPLLLAGVATVVVISLARHRAKDHIIDTSTL